LSTPSCSLASPFFHLPFLAPPPSTLTTSPCHFRHSYPLPPYNMDRLAALLSAAALMAVATGAAATTSPPGPTPTPKTMKITEDSGEECISKWFVTGYADGKWVWADVDICCPPRPMTKTMIVFRGGKRCTSTWAPCDRELNAANKCVWKICDVTDCEEPVESASRVPPLSMTAGMPRFHLSVRLRLHRPWRLPPRVRNGRCVGVPAQRTCRRKPADRVATPSTRPNQRGRVHRPHHGPPARATRRSHSTRTPPRRRYTGTWAPPPPPTNTPRPKPVPPPAPRAPPLTPPHRRARPPHTVGAPFVPPTAARVGRDRRRADARVAGVPTARPPRGRRHRDGGTGGRHAACTTVAPQGGGAGGPAAPPRGRAPPPPPAGGFSIPHRRRPRRPATGRGAARRVGEATAGVVGGC